MIKKTWPGFMVYVAGIALGRYDANLSPIAISVDIFAGWIISEVGFWLVLRRKGAAK